jgi:DNA topoisomerase IB
VRFADALAAFREALSDHMELEPMSPEWTCAVAVRLINLGWFRVGDERYAKAHKTFGITTLRKSHVNVRGSRIAFRDYIDEFMGEGRSSACGVRGEYAALAKLLRIAFASRLG